MGDFEDEVGGDWRGVTIAKMNAPSVNETAPSRNGSPHALLNCLKELEYMAHGSKPMCLDVRIMVYIRSWL